MHGKFKITTYCSPLLDIDLYPSFKVAKYENILLNWFIK